jgi:hypothetical protein
MSMSENNRVASCLAAAPAGAPPMAVTVDMVGRRALEKFEMLSIASLPKPRRDWMSEAAAVVTASSPSSEITLIVPKPPSGSIPSARPHKRTITNSFTPLLTAPLTIPLKALFAFSSSAETPLSTLKSVLSGTSSM